MARYIRQSYLKQWRRQQRQNGKKMTQAQAGAKIGVCGATWHRLENRPASVKTETLEKICLLTGLKPEQILEIAPN